MCKAIDDMRKESMAAGIAEGEARGMAAGEAKNLNQNIKTMYKNGMNVNDIVKYLGLDLVFVKKVLAEQ
jgi:DNA invertase Pin-like site-specific DNA recombinase